MIRRHFVYLAVTCFAAHALAQTSAKAFSAEEIGSMATAMLDGDIASRIVTPRALQKLTEENNADKWAGGDNYDVDARDFQQIKKTMLRLQSLAAPGTGMNLWLRIPQRSHLVQVVIRLQPGLSSFYSGEMMQELPPAFLQVFEKSTQQICREKSGLQSVLAPIYNSMGNVAALIEVVQQVQGNALPSHEHKDF